MSTKLITNLLADSTSSTGDAATGFLLIALALGAYFFPAVVALTRGCKVAPVAVVNLFFGWTLIGWVVALAMAVSKPDSK